MQSFLSHTFLIERLVGVSLYVLVIGITYNSMYRAKNDIRFNKSLNACLLILCLMAYFYVPAYTHDLARIWQIVESWKGISFHQWATVYLTNTNAPGAYFLYFIVAKLNIPRFLPTFACFIFFSNLFYIFKSERKIGRSSAKSLAITFLFIMCQGIFLGVISGVRSDIAFALVLRAAYDDLGLKKKSIKNYILCGIAITLHVSVLLVIAIYLIFSVYDDWKNGSIIRKLFSTILFGVVLAWGLRSQSVLLSDALDTARAYLNANIYSYKWEYIIAGLATLILCVILLFYSRYKKENGLYELYLYCITMTIIVLLMARSYTMFHRFANFTMYISIPLIATAIDRATHNGYGRSIIILKLICIIILFIACARGDLCGYKFFVL